MVEAPAEISVHRRVSDSMVEAPAVKSVQSRKRRAETVPSKSLTPWSAEELGTVPYTRTGAPFTENVQAGTPTAMVQGTPADLRSETPHAELAGVTETWELQTAVRPSLLRSY